MGEGSDDAPYAVQQVGKIRKQDMVREPENNGRLVVQF